MNDLLERAEKAIKAAENENLVSESKIIKELVSENKQMRAALDTITTMGKVCPDFELCTHDVCADSAGACLVAMNTLTDLGIRTPGSR